ncbi:MAG TPA: PEP-CTERM sorting domain-containing protein [Rubrivivax sp.]|nr:PEP-CTERM sorting domain-containing protein [Rubrivivax sp.]
MITRPAAARCRGLLLALCAACAPALAAPIVLAPSLAGQYQAGSGVDATFLKVDDAWHGSSVLWNEATKQYGSGQPVSSWGWGTGLWGIADWQTANHSPTAGMIQDSWSGRVAQIAWGDDAYNSAHGARWGTVDRAPLFSGAGSQDNWSSSFSGYIRITDDGLYNFSVRYDDGFFFKLHGDGSTLELSTDLLNPRDTLGFGQDLLLSAGLYAFELGAYERLEAGVVELSWSRDGGGWARVPTANLVASDAAAAVPEPATFALVAASLGLLAASRARRKRRDA